MTDTTDPSYVAIDAELQGEDLYPIREVSRLTGVNPVTLRAWERRYGLLVPHRTPSGHRLYSMADIERVRKVTAWTERGVSVSKVASIIDREVVARDTPRIAPCQPVAEASSSLQEWQARLIDAVNNTDLARLETVYGQIHSSFPLATVLYDIALPVWKLFRDNARPDGVSGQWVFLDAFLRGRLFQRIGYPRPGLPRVFLVAMPGSSLEFEILSSAALIADADANVTYIPAMPSYAELTAMIERSDCDLLALYGDRTLDADALGKGLPRLEQSLACPVAAIGPICEMQADELERAGVVVLGSSGHGLTSTVRSLLIGRLDTR